MRICSSSRAAPLELRVADRRGSGAARNIYYLPWCPHVLCSFYAVVDIPTGYEHNVLLLAKAVKERPPAFQKRAHGHQSCTHCTCSSVTAVGNHGGGSAPLGRPMMANPRGQHYMPMYPPTGPPQMPFPMQRPPGDPGTLTCCYLTCDP